jgi:ATP:ADP antiporter, AAA family
MKIFEILRGADSRYRRGIWYFFIAYFFVLFNYPLIRASSTTLFFDAFGAKSSPKALLWAILFLSGSILFFNKLQAKKKVQSVFLIASTLSVAIFAGCSYFYGPEAKILGWGLFIWKEIYIVVQIHLLLAYANNYFEKDHFKYLLGPLGAAGSLGGILGGLLTSFLGHRIGTLGVMGVGIIFVFVPAILFLFTPAMQIQNKKVSHSPLSSLQGKNLRRYVFIIAGIVALSQFIINIADFQFNIEFEAAIKDSSSRTSYLGNIYTVINGITLIFQLLILPVVLPRVSEKNYHLFIPFTFVLCVGALMAGSAVGLLPVAILYAYFKASDYSLFSAGKEILYQPLEPEQKYGAKYLTDMLVYRLSKAAVSAVLIYLQSSTILNMLMLTFLFIWIVLVVELFRVRKELF